MRVVIQRVREASVTIAGERIAAIGRGFLLLVGVGPDDTMDDADYLAHKIAHMRVFADDNGKMNLALEQIDGAILSVSQFTLFADTRRGNRPSFTGAAAPETAEQLYHYFNAQLEQESGRAVQTGRFGADMQVALVNDGPVTILMDSKDK